MNIKSSKQNIIVVILSFIVFFSITYALNNTSLALFTVSGVRPTAAMNPILGIIFGWPAIISCAIANFLSDLLSPNYGINVAFLGLIPQIIYGAFPYYAWRKYVVSTSHISRIDSPKKIIVLSFIMFFNSVIIGLEVGAIQCFVAKADFLSIVKFVIMNDFESCIIFGVPMMTLYDYYYSKFLHRKKRNLSANEIVILVSSVIQIITVTIITAMVLAFPKSSDSIYNWNKIFEYSLHSINVIIICSVITMFIVKSRKNKYEGLRIIEKKNGTIFVDEKKKLEFVSAPGRELKYRVKINTLGIDYDNGRKNARPSFENAWIVMLSTQKGCDMKCKFCDAPAHGFYGNVSREELRYQIKSVLENTGSTYTKRFEVDFMRMGDPLLNPDVLKFIEFDLKDLIEQYVDADEIIPSISTVSPGSIKNVKDCLLEYCRIKNDVYNGNIGIQFSINTTDENTRQKLIGRHVLTIKEIADIISLLPMPKGSKYALNFAVTKDSIIDAKFIDSLFDKSKCMIKITPVHETFNAVDNGFNVTTEYNEYDVFEKFEKEFLSLGWDVIVYTDSKEDDDNDLTCGHLVLSNISDKLSERAVAKKKVGMVVAIEMEAFFEKYPNAKEIPVSGDFRLFSVVMKEYDLFVIQAGMGEIAASSAVQYLVSKCEVSAIVNFGVVGGLTQDMKKLKVCLVEKVVHYKYDCSEFMPLEIGQVDGHDSIYLKTSESLVKKVKAITNDIALVTCCSGDKFVSTAKEKNYLHETFGGDICDMESAGIVLTCEANHIPCLLLKAVSDGLADGAEGFYAELKNASMGCLDVTAKVLEEIALIE